MITRIEIDGFKTFQDFAVDLAPFQVIIGPNGCGKSNFFEALRLLSLLTQHDFPSVFREIRGEPHELFTVQPNGEPGERMRFAVELLVERTVKDNWGARVELPNPRLRYELEIRYAPLDAALNTLYIADERLTSIPVSEDRWLETLTYRQECIPTSHGSQEKQIFISANDGEPPNNVLTLHEDSAGIVKQERRIQLAFSRQTSLGRVDSCDFPHILAVHQEMEKWIPLESRLGMLRLPSILTDNRDGIGGSYIPFLLAAMKEQDQRLLGDVSRDLANLIPNLRRIEVEKNDYSKRYEIYAAMRDGRRIPGRLLSDGIARLLSLATLKNSPDQRGVLLLEEPENSVHPGQLKRLVRLLRNMTTDFSDPEQAEGPLRQLLVTTHSPTLVSQLDLTRGELLLAEMAMRIKPREYSMQVTLMTPVLPDAGRSTPEGAYTLDRTYEYLNSTSLETARAGLRRAGK